MARIAIIGTGISGLGAAFLLHPRHDITIYERAPRIGGHARTVTVDYDGRAIPVDTGFIVFNRPNYPHLSGLFQHLNVPVHESDMSFAASIRDGWLEWGAKDVSAIFGQKRNLLRPRFALLVRDVMRFNAGAQAAVERHPHFTLDQLIDHLGLGDWFRRFYLLPMAGAIWSCPFSEMLRFPAEVLVRFFANHHLLSVTGQPQWYTVTGGSRQYVERLIAPFAHRIRTSCGAVAVTRAEGKVQVRDSRGEVETYDQVVLASHGDESLALLKDADGAERSALSPFRYQKNLAILHRDESVMPRRRRCWASWVYSSDGKAHHPKITVSYWMNRLQGIDQRYPLFVSLNPKQPIDEKHIFDAAEFHHPIFDSAAIAAQSAVQARQGLRNTWFCGAHLRHGFHEDGLASAVHVARQMGCAIPWEAKDAEVQGWRPRSRPLQPVPSLVPAE